MPRRPEISEGEFQRRVIADARRYGWLVAHVEKAQRRPGKWTTPTTAGFPDVVLVRPPRVVFLELKRQSGKPSPEQAEWIVSLQACGEVEAYIVRPSDARHIDALLAPDSPTPAIVPSTTDREGTIR